MKLRVLSAIGPVLFLLVVLCSGCGPDWRETYEYDEKDPFDLYVLHQLLSARPQGLVMLPDSLGDLVESKTTGNYVFVGDYAYYNERDLTHLLDFVEAGNRAFIAASELPPELAELLYGSDCYFQYEEFQPVMAFEDDDDVPGYRDTIRVSIAAADTTHYELVNIYNWMPVNRRHGHINEFYLCDPELANEAIGTLDTNYISFARLTWGEGEFYVNTLPKYFTNFYLVDSNYHRYAEGVMTLAIADGPVYWDEVSRVPPAVARDRRRQQNPRRLEGRNLLSGNETLSFIQRQPPLAFAWYLIIAALLLFVFFRGKRRQRIIPILNVRENSSKRFIDTLSRLVYQKGHHGSLARQEVRSLRFYLQDRYGIRWKPGEPLPDNFGELTGATDALVARADIELKIVHDKAYLDETALVNFYRAIEPLYHLSTHAGPTRPPAAKPNTTVHDG